MGSINQHGFGVYEGTAPSFWEALKNGLWDIFFPAELGLLFKFNVPLWTMQIELKGSLLAFAFLLLFGDMKKRWLIYGILVFVFGNTYYLAIIAGVILADIFYSSDTEKLRVALDKIPGLALLSLIGGVFLASFAFKSPYAVYDYMNYRPIFEFFALGEYFYHIVGAVLLVYAAAKLDLLRHILSAGVLSVLGKYSFALYLVHFPIILSFTGQIFLYFWRRDYAYGDCLLWATLATVPFLVVATRLMHNYVEQPLTALTKRFRVWMTKE